MSMVDMRVRVLLSAQRALLGHIGKSVRAIKCRWAERAISVRIIFDGEIAEDDARAMSEAQTEMNADFFPGATADFALERCDSPAPIHHDSAEVTLFQRLEQ